MSNRTGMNEERPLTSSSARLTKSQCSSKTLIATPTAASLTQSAKSSSSLSTHLSPGEFFLTTYCPPKPRKGARSPSRGAVYQRHVPTSIGAPIQICTIDPADAYVSAEVERQRIKALTQLIRNGEGSGSNRITSATHDLSHTNLQSEVANKMPPLTVASTTLKTYQSRSYTLYPCFMCGHSFDSAALGYHHTMCEQDLNIYLRMLGRHPFCGLVGYPTSALMSLTGSSIPGEEAPLESRSAYSTAAARAYGGFRVLCRGCGGSFPIGEALDHFDVCGNERAIPVEENEYVISSAHILASQTLDQTAMEKQAVNNKRVVEDSSPQPRLHCENNTGISSPISRTKSPTLFARYPSIASCTGSAKGVPDKERGPLAATILDGSQAFARTTGPLASVASLKNGSDSLPSTLYHADPCAPLVAAVVGCPERLSILTSNWPRSPVRNRTNSPLRQASYDGGRYMNTRLTNTFTCPGEFKPSVAEMASHRSTSPRIKRVEQISVGGLTGGDVPRQAKAIVCAPRPSKRQSDTRARW